MFYVFSGLYAVITVVSLVIFIIMLIKQFKHGGILHGLLGLITCGLYTFIWGWIKHKDYALTKMMMTWSILWVASIIVPAVMTSFGFAEFYKYFEQIQGEMIAGGVNAKHKKLASKTAFVPNSRKKTITRKSKSGPAGIKPATQQKVAPEQAALALWQDGKYTDPNKAAQYWSAVIQSNPNSAEAYNNRGLAYYNLKQFQKSIKDFDKAISIKSNYAVAYNNRGNAYYNLGQFTQALTNFNKSLKINSKYANAHYNSGLAYLQLQNKTQSCREFNLACNYGECEGLQWAMQNGICK